MSKSTTVITSTTALSGIADSIRAETQASGQAPSKQRLLNIFAQGIAGPKHDWGFLTGSNAPVVQKGLPTARLEDLENIGAAPALVRPPLRSADLERPFLLIKPTYLPLYEPEMAAYLRKQMSGDFIAIFEQFSTAGEHETEVQCMFDPKAIFAKEGTIEPISIWGGTPEDIERTGRAYFASSSSHRVNALVYTIIADWPEDAMSETFIAFHMPHAIVITSRAPFNTLFELGYHQAEEKEEAQNILDAGFQIFIDETLDEKGRAQAKKEVEDFLNRLATYLRCQDPALANIALL